MKLHIPLLGALTLLLAFQPTRSGARIGDEKTAQMFSASTSALSFIENKGQVTDQHNKLRSDIDFKVKASGMSIFIGDGQLHYQWSKTIMQDPPAPNANLSHEEGRAAFRKFLEEGVKTETYRMDVVLVGANKAAQVIKEDKQSYSENYYLPQYKGAASAFSKVTYKNIYPNIDWVLYTQDNHLKYDFIVHPGGDPKDIKLQYKGATSLNLKSGALTATTPYGSVTEQKPYSYDAVTRKEIPSSFVLSENTLSFNIVANNTHDIVIDPFLQWATYYGDANTDYGHDVSTNSFGDAYMTGYTGSTSNIATAGAHQTTLGGSWDAFIVKFNHLGARQWATYFGGTNQDWLSSSECDPSGNLYVAGETYSTGLATAGAHQTTLGGSYDAILAKFSSSGVLQWCTYFGGPSWEYADVTCDASGNVYIGGETYSTTGIATAGAYQATLSGNYDAFLARFSSAGVLQWSTYFGGPSQDWGHGVECDPSGNIYLGGGTYSTSGIATTGAHQTTLGGNYDGFVSKWTSSGSLSWATYFGGSSWDYVNGLSCDPSGNVYAAGWTYSTTGIATTGAHQTVLNSSTSSQYDGFLAKFNSSGVQQWGTYYGGSSWDHASSVEVGINGYIYLGGMTASSTDISTTNGHQPTFAGGTYDAYLAEFTASGVRQWATYYGGSGYDYLGNGWGGGGGGGGGWGGGDGMTTSPTGKLYFAGLTNSTSGIATTGAHQTVLGNTNSTYDAFLTSWIIDTIVYINQPFIDTSWCPGDTFRLHYSVTYPFRSGNTFTAQLSNAAGSFATPVNIGAVSATNNGNILVQIPRNATPGTGYRIRIVATNPNRTSIDNGVNIRIKPLPVVSASSNSPVCEQASLNLSASSTSTGTVTYLWSGPGSYGSSNQNPTRTSVTTTMAGDYIVTAIVAGCKSSDTTSVVVNIIPDVPVAGSNSPVCPNTPMNLNALSSTSGVTYSWTGPQSFGSSMQSPQVSTNATTGMAGIYSVTASRYGCTSAPGTTNVIVAITTPTPTATANSPLCAGATLNLSALAITGATYVWTGPNGFTSTSQTPFIPTVQPRHAGKYTVQATVNNCVSLPSDVVVVVNVVSTIGAYASPNDTICKGATGTFVAFPMNPGPKPDYQWYKNFSPIPGANKLIYTDNGLMTGDRIYCRMIAKDVCDVDIEATTDTFDMVVLPIVTIPAVEIKANPGFGIGPNEQVTFTAVVANGGTTPKYQWYKNGVILPGAKYATLVTSGLVYGDRISVDITSEDPCAEQKAASDTVTIGHPTGIADRNGSGSVMLYPNPNKGSFTVSGITAAEVNVTIINAVGQVVYTDNAKRVTGELNVNTQLAQGVYLIRLSNSNGFNQTLKFTITE